MNRFIDRIRQKAQDYTQPPVLIVALGDSVTQGVMEHQLLDAKSVYHRVLQTKLEDFFPTTTFSTINAGISGGNAVQGLARLDRDVVKYQPDLVLIGFGLNDCLSGMSELGNFVLAIGEMIEGIRHQTQADIILLTPPFMATKRSNRIHPDHLQLADVIIRAQTDGTLANYAEALRNLGKKHSVALADIHAKWQMMSENQMDTDLWLINGLNHPDSRGQALAAEIVFSEIYRQV